MANNALSKSIYINDQDSNDQDIQQGQLLIGSPNDIDHDDALILDHRTDLLQSPLRQQSIGERTSNSSISDSFDVTRFGFIDSLFNSWYKNNSEKFQKIKEYEYSIDDLLSIYLNSMNDDDIPQVLMPDYEEKIKNILLNTELNIHGYGYKQLIEGSIRDNSFTMSRYRRFETKTQTWIKQNYPTYRNQSRLINVLLLNEDLWQASENKLLQFLSNDTNNNNKEYYTFYHGCLEYAAHSICLNDLGLHWNYPKGTDFGPGVYVTRNLFDALCVAKRRSLYQPSSSKFDEEQNRPACIIFQCPKEEFDTFSILKLEVNNLDLSADRQPLISQDIEENEIFKWDKFVHLCHDQRYPLPLVKSYDGIEGHICNNIRQVQAGIHGPKSQLNSWQLCVQSVRFAEKFTSWISGIILLQLPS